MPLLNTKPRHVAIIMDGNGRWAKKRYMPRTMGHKRGSEQLRKIVIHANELKIEALSVYAFSKENWKRPEEEIEFLFKLIGIFFEKYINELIENNVKVSFLGSDELVPTSVLKIIEQTEKRTSLNSGLKLNIAFNYSSHDEITLAHELMFEKYGKFDSSLVSEFLYTKDLPPLDLLIRTSGEIRISNFFLWQIAYAELYFTDVLWPDFSIKEFDKALVYFESRNRRFGGLK